MSHKLVSKQLLSTGSYDLVIDVNNRHISMTNFLHHKYVLFSVVKTNIYLTKLLIQMERILPLTF